MNTLSCKSCETSTCLIKKYCSAKFLDKTDRNIIQIQLNSNQSVFNEVSPVLGIYFIKSGTVKIYLSGKAKKNQIVRFARKGQIFGHRGTKNEIYGLNAVTMEKSTICFVDNNTLNELFINNPDFTVGLMMYYSHELRKMENRVKSMAQMCIREKIADALLLLHETTGSNKKDEIDFINIREDLANIAGTNIQQVSRQLSDFEGEGLLERNGKKITILNIERVKEIIKKHH